jgi:hypothetical protein
MGRLRINPDHVLTPAERLKRFRDRRRGLPVPEAPRVMTPPLPTMVEAMEDSGMPPLASVDELVEVDNAHVAAAPAPPERVVGPATPLPLRFDPLALIG